MTRAEMVAALRAEIERDGVHVAISDDELWEAAVSPLREARLRHLAALADLGPRAERSAAAMKRLADTLADD